MSRDGIQPKGERLRRALRWLSDEGRHDGAALEEAATRFDLTPIEESFLRAHLREVSGMQVRDVARGDLAAVHGLNAASLPAVSEVSVEGFEWFLGVADYFRLIAFDGKLAGFLLGLRPGRPYDSINYRWFCARYRDFFYIDRLAVDDRFRRRGVASMLYADIERQARALRTPLLACEVNVKPRNEGSLAYHAHHGFIEVGRQDTDAGAKRVSMMVKLLSADAGPAGSTR